MYRFWSFQVKYLLVCEIHKKPSVYNIGRSKALSRATLFSLRLWPILLYRNILFQFTQPLPLKIENLFEILIIKVWNIEYGKIFRMNKMNNLEKNILNSMKYSSI